MRKQLIDCLIPDCKDAGGPRGLCRPHYDQARFLVIKGEYSWKELEKRGKVSSKGKTAKTEVEGWFKK